MVLVAQACAFAEKGQFLSFLLCQEGQRSECISTFRIAIVSDNALNTCWAEKGLKKRLRDERKKHETVLISSSPRNLKFLCLGHSQENTFNKSYNNTHKSNQTTTTENEYHAQNSYTQWSWSLARRIEMVLSVENDDVRLACSIFPQMQKLWDAQRLDDTTISRARLTAWVDMHMGLCSTADSDNWVAQTKCQQSDVYVCAPGGTFNTPPVLFPTSVIQCFLKLYSRKPCHAADDKPSHLLGDCAVRSILETSMMSNGMVETASITNHGVPCQTNLFQDGMTCQGQMALISGCYNQNFITLFRLDGGNVCLVIWVQKENTKRKTKEKENHLNKGMVFKIRNKDIRHQLHSLSSAWMLSLGNIDAMCCNCTIVLDSE